ncbi:MAG: glycosyltransferase [Planctomycetota bacterium]
MRILILTHSTGDPSFRIRWGQHLDALREMGIECQVREIGRRGRRALFDEARGTDAVVLHRRLLNPRHFRSLRRRTGRLIYDFDDALCFRDRPPHRSLTRTRRFLQAVGGSDQVFAGNRVLAGLARLRARRVFVLPSTVAVQPLPDVKKRPEFTAVWIGQRATLPHLELVRSALTEAGIRLRVISDAAPPDTEHLPWSLAGERTNLAECHAGLMPLPSDPFARGKCGYKLLQYYEAGLPAVASPVGVNRLLAGGGALLAKEPAEWVAALHRLRNDPELRERLGRLGRTFVSRRYAAGPLATRMAQLLLEA